MVIVFGDSPPPAAAAITMATTAFLSSFSTPYSSVNHSVTSIRRTVSNLLINNNTTHPIAIFRTRNLCLKRLNLPEIFLNKYPYGISARTYGLTRIRPVSPVMVWQDCSVKMEIDVPISVAYNCYLDREAISRWMPFISSVKILEDKPDLSRWTLKYEAFGQNIEFAWLARNMQPIPNQKIHWRSLEGLPNRGAVRFFPKGPSACLVELTVSYEIPQILTPVASALQPFLKSLLLRGLESFATFAKESQKV